MINSGHFSGADLCCRNMWQGHWQCLTASCYTYVCTYEYVCGMHQTVGQAGWQSVSEAVGPANLFVSIAATKVWPVMSKQIWWHMHKALTATYTPSHTHTHRQTDGTKRCLGQHLVTKLFCFWSAFEIDAIVYLANQTSLSVSLSLLLSLPLLFSVRSTYKLFAAYQRVAVVHFYGHLLLFSPFLVTYPGPVGSPIERRIEGGEWGQAGAVCVSPACAAHQSPGIWRCWSDACVADLLCVCVAECLVCLVCVCACNHKCLTHTHTHRDTENMEHTYRSQQREGHHLKIA